MNAQHAKKLLVSTMLLSLTLSGGLLIGGDRAGAAGSAGLSRQGLTVGQYAQLQDMKSRWRKQTDDMHKGGSAIVEEAAEVIGIDREQVKKQLADGKSLVEIASAKGVSEAVLKEKLLALRTAKLQEAVKSGKITQERADTIKSRLESHIAAKLNQKGWTEEGGFGGHGHKHGKAGGVFSQLGPDKLASILGITKEELVKELKAGKSLSEIAQSKGISKEQLVAKIQEELKPLIESSVDRKHQADKNK